MTPDIEKLRRFALVVALILISYAAAGVELEHEAKFSLLGLPFIIRRPDLLLLGLMLASFYSLSRFFYYAVMLKHSPQRRRADLFRQMKSYGGYGTSTNLFFFGPPTYETSPQLDNKNEVESRMREIVDAFPKVMNFRASGRIEADRSLDDDGEIRVYYEAKITIPFLCRAAAFIEDIDYTMPIWLNAVALALSVSVIWPSS